MILYLFPAFIHSLYWDLVTYRNNAEANNLTSSSVIDGSWRIAIYTHYRHLLDNYRIPSGHFGAMRQQCTINALKCSLYTYYNVVKDFLEFPNRRHKLAKSMGTCKCIFVQYISFTLISNV